MTLIDSVTVINMMIIIVIVIMPSAVLFILFFTEHICLVPCCLDKYLKRRVQVNYEDE